MNHVVINVVLPIRSSTGTRGRAILNISAQGLWCDSEMQTEGLPWLHGELAIAAPRRLDLVLQVHNRAGIPIIEGYSSVETGQRQFTFVDLHAVGIEAYAHASVAQRLQVAQRVWSRRSFGTLRLLSTPGPEAKSRLF